MSIFIMATAMEKGDNCKDLLAGYITCAEKFMSICKDLRQIKGAQKLEKMCRSELRYLMTLNKRHFQTKESELKSSNLSHFAGILHSACHFPEITRLLKPFSLVGKTESLIVDVVAGQGRIWVKVIARKAQALHLIWAGKGQFGERDLLKQAVDYMNCAKEHQVCFAPPKIHFVFYNQVTEEMADALRDIGVIVWGERVKVSQDILNKVQDLEWLSDDSGDCDEEGTDEGSDDSDNEYESGNPLMLSHSTPICRDMSQQNVDNSSQNIRPKRDHEFQCSYINNAGILNTSVSFKDHIAADEAIDYDTDKLMFDSKKNCLDFFKTCGVIPKIITSFPFNSYSDLESRLANEQTSIGQCLNLDITTLITMVSSVTHGGCYFVFPDPILTQQAEEERKKPVLPELTKLLQGKELFACQTAVDSFYSVVNTLGGTKEKERTEEFMRKVRIVPDQPSERTRRLPETGKIKKRSKIIFGTGDELKAVTVTANVGFVRAAEHQGITFAVHLIPSRPLTEAKEKLAQPLNPSA